MQIVKIKSVGADVVYLQRKLAEWGYRVDETGLFDIQTEDAVRRFQKSQRLGADGIVGAKTWSALENEAERAKNGLRLTESDFVRAAEQLEVEVAAIKAVQEVETGGRGGFFAVGRPAILFEGHVFWNQLIKEGLDPQRYIEGNRDILYPRWTKEHYVGGMGEYKRLVRALAIHDKAAAASASWGMFQIMGFNYRTCGCNLLREFIDEMCTDEGKQLDLFVRFLQNNGWDRFLRQLDWAKFARHYNGPGYAENRYDEKMAQAYQRHRATEPR